jgi:5-oxopent-3-ene-1,2,5-tricarboxylate decarboxylase/2-hydroxyhepta-2,4-diene-1,7-dioate isomerase
VKRARFMANGRYHEGHLAEAGVLIDEGGTRHDEKDLTFLPPFEVGKVIGLALNYADHAEELGLERPKEPALFFKPNSSLVGHRTPVVYPYGVQYMHYEVELAVVIGRRCRRVPQEDAMAVVRGYTIANDVTVRDFVGNLYRPPVRAKGWDTFCPLGPYLVEGEIDDPNALGLRTLVNGSLRQEGNTKDLMWKVPEMIEFITRFMTLEDGDVLLTGTPRGLSHVYPGDEMELEIDGLGTLVNPIVGEPEGGKQ